MFKSCLALGSNLDRVPLYFNLKWEGIGWNTNTFTELMADYTGNCNSEWGGGKGAQIVVMDSNQLIHEQFIYLFLHSHNESSSFHWRSSENQSGTQSEFSGYILEHLADITCISSVCGSGFHF